MVKQKAFVVGVGLLLLIGLIGITIAAQAQTESAQPVSAAGAIAQEVRTLVAQEVDSFGTGAGWIHIVSRNIRNQDRAGVLPNGQPIPVNYIDDTWFQVNDKNSVIATVAIMKTLDGQPRQISTLRDGVERNLTFGEKYPLADPVVLELDFGFSADVTQASSDASSKITRQEENVSGRSALTYSVQDGVSAPTQVEGYKKTVVSGERRASFDKKTGQTLFLERIFVMADGTRQIAERTDVMTLEKVSSPPAEVLNLLNQEVTP